jgi:hypothetical protein
MRHHWTYLKYVLRHKWFVFLEGRKIGVPLLNLILHDWDKFKPAMWRSYANYFYNFKNLMTDERAHHLKRAVPGYDWESIYTQEKCKHEFNETWRRHQHINRHHWQEAIRKDDDGTEDIMEMKEADVLEMIADWRGASRSRPDPKPLPEWYAETKANRKFHPKTLRLVEKLLGIESDGTNP